MESLFDIIFNCKAIELGGYTGEKGWRSKYGEGGAILASVDGNNWKDIGIMPDFCGKIVDVEFSDYIKLKYLKFISQDWLAIGFLGIKTYKNI